MSFRVFCASKHDTGGRRPARARRGFTLVELMVVLVLIGMLAGVVTVGVRSYLVAGRQEVAKLEISKICSALQTYATFAGDYPDSDQGLAVLAESSDRFVEGLLSTVPKDPWGNEYDYIKPGREGKAFEVICYGADGDQGGEGEDRDISSADLDNEEEQ